MSCGNTEPSTLTPWHRPGATARELSPAEIGGSSHTKLIFTAAIGGLVGTVLVRNFIETEKKIQHRIRTSYGTDDERFVRTMSQILGPPLLEGNAITTLQNGDEILPAMLEAIHCAERSVTFENFVFSAGVVVDDFVQALSAAARRGVKVRFLQDAIGCNCLHGREMRTLRRSGVQVEIFRYMHITRFNHRTHRKLLIIDGKLGFVGGIGISDEWLGNGTRPDRWRDCQYRVEGPVVGQMQQAFTDNWIKTRGAVLHGDDYFPRLSPAGTLKSQVFRSSASEAAESARLMFLFSFAAARKSIRIINPYFIPDPLTVRMLCEACTRGVSVEIIAPGPLIDQRVVRLVGRAQWGPLLRAGARFYEFKPARLHTKCFIVDDRWVSVGSCNLDDRSLCLNDEANLNVLDEGFAAEQTRIFEADKQRSIPISYADWRARPMSEKIIGRTAGLLRSQM